MLSDIKGLQKVFRSISTGGVNTPGGNRTNLITEAVTERKRFRFSLKTCFHWLLLVVTGRYWLLFRDE